MDWKLKHQVTGPTVGLATTKTFAAWGLGQPTLTFVNQGKDTASFAAPGRATDAANLFALGGGGIKHSITIIRDTTPVFVGTITDAPRNGDGGREDNRFSVAGPWWMLEELIYEQSWKSWNGVALIDVFSSHLFLGQAPDGTYLTNSQVVAAVVAYAAPIVLASSGMVITADLTGFDGIPFPVSEVRDLSCAEAIKKVLRYTPDAKLWWDYSGANPVMRVARRSALVAVALPIGAVGTQLVSLAITPRLDLLRPVVILDFEVSSTVNGVAYTNHVIDKYPVDGADRAVRAYKSTINLQGQSVLQAFIQTRPILPLTANWWALREAWINDPTVTQFTPPPSVTRQSNLQNELVQGQIADWMRFGNGNSVLAVQDTIVGTGNVSQSGSVQMKVFSTNIIATNATTGLYSAVQNFGEPVPVGMAQHFYEAVNTLHWQGSLTIVEDEFTGAIGLQHVLNLTGGLAEWATMNAFVWSVSVDAGAGRTTLDFGPSENLGPADLSDLARASRNRVLVSSPATRITGQAGTSFALGRSVANTQASSATAQHSVFEIKDPNPVNVTKIEINIADALGKGIKLREYSICVEDEEKRVLLLGSEPYDPPDP